MELRKLTSPKLDAFRAMVAKAPTNALARFGLANELIKGELWEEAREHLEIYLASYDDEGNGWLRLGDVYVRLSRTADARAAFTRGIEASTRFGHHGMRGDIEERLDELDTL
jgi:predicted Zn-dependent protease